MKYLFKTSKATLTNMNQAAWERCLGREVNPEDVTRYLCAMVEDETGAELHILDADIQWFTETVQGQMTDAPQIIIEEEEL